MLRQHVQGHQHQQWHGLVQHTDNLDNTTQDRDLVANHTIQCSGNQYKDFNTTSNGNNHQLSQVLGRDGQGETFKEQITPEDTTPRLMVMDMEIVIHQHQQGKHHMLGNITNSTPKDREDHIKELVKLAEEATRTTTAEEESSISATSKPMMSKIEELMIMMKKKRRKPVVLNRRTNRPQCSLSK